MSAIVVRTGANRTIDLYLSDIPEGTTVAGGISPTAADRLTHCKSMQFPEPSSDDIDTTDWDSQAKEFENGMTDFGEAQSVRNLNSDEYETAMDVASAGTKKALTIVVKNKAGTAVIQRQGFCTVKAPSVGNTEVDGVLEVTTSYKMSGNLAKFTGTLPT